MTTRPSLPAFELLRYTRQKTIAQAITITRQDGQVIRLTDHDRPLRLADNRVYTPAIVAQVSEDRAEAAVRAGRQDARGMLDGIIFTAADMDAYRYRGAEVSVQVVDWRRPWLVFARHRKWIRNVTRDGSAWVAQMESRAQELQRPTGGRFGGTFTTTCPYELGGTYCKKNISADTKTVEVDTVVDERRVAQFTTASWTGTYVDDYYRDGSLIWLTGNNAGHVSAIVRYQHSNRECELFFPTPRPIQVGDTATAKPGCDGLLSTCRTKFSNQLNFGGDPFAPSASQIIEPVEDV